MRQSVDYILKLDFGSGHNPRKGFKTCDITQAPYLDYAFDPETYKVTCEDHVFDEIIIRNVLHHIKDLESLFKEMKRILTNNGKLIIVEPRKEFYQQNLNLDILWYRYIIPRYEIWYSRFYRDCIEIAKTFFKVKNVFYNNEKETIILG